jgi:hypothetical protein
MVGEDDLDLEHLEWLVHSRSENQRVSIALLKLLIKHREKLEGDLDPRVIATEFVAIAFSLWRAVFLADKIGSEESLLQQATHYLGRIISDNAIGYQQDRSAREWAFNYYITSIHFRLEEMSKIEPKIVSSTVDYFKSTSRKSQGTRPQKIWTHYHKIFADSVEKFSEILNAD